MFGIGKPELRAIEKSIAMNHLTRFQGGTKGYLARFERKLAAKIGVEHVLAVNSGTSALISALVALGVGPGDEVLVSAYTWISTPLAPMLLGAVPVLVEVDETLTMCPLDLERKINKRTKAIMPIHMCNLPCDMDRIMALAAQYNIPVVEDACQAVGGWYKGKRLGSFGAINAFSFNSYKNISCGEGGAILTNDPLLFDRARLYHDAGTFVQSYDTRVQIPHFAGQDYRASEIDGAMLYEQLKRLDPGMEKWRERRRLAAAILEAGGLKLAPHNDVGSAVTLAIQFADVAEAQEYAARHRISRFIDSGRHVYTNWEPLVQRQAYRDDVNPLLTPLGLKQRYDEKGAPQTLDILRRTCNVTPVWNMPRRELEKYYLKLTEK
ncbi:MAG: DegT/DnrJ/EryC1/StrS family aminotransferase [Victivallaceae bacterium]